MLKHKCMGEKKIHINRVTQPWQLIPKRTQNCTTHKHNTFGRPSFLHVVHRIDPECPPSILTRAWWVFAKLCHQFLVLWFEQHWCLLVATSADFWRLSSLEPKEIRKPQDSQDALRNPSSRLVAPFTDKHPRTLGRWYNDCSSMNEVCTKPWNRANKITREPWQSHEMQPTSSRHWYQGNPESLKKTQENVRKTCLEVVVPC